MRRSRLAALALIALLITGAGYLALLALGVFAPSAPYRPVPAGHREIVFLAPATSGDAWERLVAAVDALHDESHRAGSGRPKLLLDKQRAFVDLTADVPEVSLWLEGAEDARLWIRWYKLSAENNSERWVKLLTERGTPPLAFLGGDTSFRALRVAQALERHRDDWGGNPPLLLITTATADRYIPNDVGNSDTVDVRWPRLIDIYKGRSFRFSFTNSRMAAMVLDFIRTHDDQLWPGAADNDALVAARLMAPDPLQAVALARAADDRLTPCLTTLKWDDDSFSADLADRFKHVFQRKYPLARDVNPNQIEYSVGDFYQPNPSEAFVAGMLLPELEALRDHRQLMLLPANAERARRFLRTLIRRSTPQDWRNLVVMTGDSLNFNTIYRDRDIAWNIQDLPVPLVLFSHRNPVDEEVGFREGAGAGGTGTEDLLLYRDILEALLLTAYQGTQPAASADAVLSGFRHLRWVGGRVKAPAPAEAAPLLFNPQDGDRNDGTGEHIIVLQPDADDRGRLAQATVTVWHVTGDTTLASGWRVVRSLRVVYDGLASDRPG